MTGFGIHQCFGIGNNRITGIPSDGRLYRISANTGRDDTTRGDHNPRAICRLREPTHRRTGQLNGKRCRSTIAKDRTGDRRKRERTRSCVIPDLSCLFSDEPNLAAPIDHHRLPRIRGDTPLSILCRIPRGAVIECTDIEL